MDPVAHTLVGASLAETGLRRTSPLATATLLLGANAPDLDIAASALGSDAALQFRRGHTHGVLAMLLLPLAIAVTPEGYRFVQVSWLSEPGLRESHPPLPGDERTEVVRAALEAPSVRGMSQWMRFPSYEVARLEDGWRVTIRDVRYSRSDAPIGTATVELDEDLEPR